MTAYRLPRLVPSAPSPQKANPAPVKPGPRPGLISTRQILKSENGKKEVIDEVNKTDFYPSAANETGLVGLDLGLTIPGPKNSYMSAVIRIICYLPTRHGTDEQVHATFKRIEAIIEREMDHHVDEVKQVLGV